MVKRMMVSIAGVAVRSGTLTLRHGVAHIEPVLKKKKMKNPNVNTDYLPDSEREVGSPGVHRHKL